MSEEKIKFCLELTKRQLEELLYDCELNEREPSWWLKFDYQIIIDEIKKQR